MTAAFSPAEQLTFRPRTVGEVDAVERHLAAVPAWTDPGMGAAEPAPVASVHRLPVVHLDRVYRRRRLAVLAVIVGLVLGVVAFIGAADATPTPGSVDADSAVTVIVQPGDTLWAIAVSLDPDADPRALTTKLTELTGSTVLSPGQELLVPAAWLD